MARIRFRVCLQSKHGVFTARFANGPFHFMSHDVGVALQKTQRVKAGVHCRIVQLSREGQVQDIACIVKTHQGNVGSGDVFIPCHAAGIEAQRLPGKAGSLFVVADEEVFRREIALSDVVARIELSPLLVALNGLLNISRAQVVVKRGDVETVAHGLPVGQLKRLPNAVGRQGVLVEVVITDSQIGAGKSKLGIESDGFLQCGNSFERALFAAEAPALGKRLYGLQRGTGSALKRQIELFHRGRVFSQFSSQFGSRLAECVHHFPFPLCLGLYTGNLFGGRALERTKFKEVSAVILRDSPSQESNGTELQAKLSGEIAGDGRARGN